MDNWCGGRKEEGRRGEGVEWGGELRWDREGEAGRAGDHKQEASIEPVPRVQCAPSSETWGRHLADLDSAWAGVCQKQRPCVESLKDGYSCSLCLWILEMRVNNLSL